MSDNEDTKRSEADAELEREIRKGRKFTLEEAIGRLAGPGASVRNALSGLLEQLAPCEEADE